MIAGSIEFETVPRRVVLMQKADIHKAGQAGIPWRSKMSRLMHYTMMHYSDYTMMHYIHHGCDVPSASNDAL